MVNQNRIPRALSTLILLGYLAMGLGGQSAAVAADNKDAVIPLGTFSNKMSDDVYEDYGTQLLLWRKEEVLLGAAIKVTAGAAFGGLIINGHYHPATHKLDFIVEFPDPATEFDTKFGDSKPVPRAVKATKYDLTIVGKTIYGTRRDIYYDVPEINQKFHQDRIESISLPRADVSGPFFHVPTEPFKNEDAWFEYAWCSLARDGAKDLFTSFQELKKICPDY
jgi:hypothetical protein